MTEEKNNDLFSTTDITVASILLTLKFDIIKIDYQIVGAKPRSEGIFYFENSPELNIALRKNLSKDLAVEPNTLMANLRSLKSEINNMCRNLQNN